MGAFGLTQRQKECLDFVNWFIRENGYSPSFQEISDALDLRSKSAAHRLMHGLRDRGHIDMMDNRARSVVMIEDHPDAE